MGMVCSTHGKGVHRGLLEKPDGKNVLEDIHLVGRIILKWL
jgi:hypothetical protein